MTKEWRQDAGKRIEQATSVKELDDILYDLNELEPDPDSLEAIKRRRWLVDKAKLKRECLI